MANPVKFANLMLEQSDIFSEKIIFSDEAHFHLNSYLNEQTPRLGFRKYKSNC